MNSIKIIIFLMIIISSINAKKNQIRIVGSSTVYPFSSAVAEEFGAITKYLTPVVESTGSGGGIKLFCASSDKKTPDITNTSRKMKLREFEKCYKNGVKEILEVNIGFDGVVFSQSKFNKIMNITQKELFLALAKEVPSKDGKNLILNPYKKWNEINSLFPKRKIIIYGPPKSSGTRDAFEDIILKAQSKKIDLYNKLYETDKKKYISYKKYKKIRTDGAYIPSGENDNLIVLKLNKNREAFGIFGYSFLLENEDKVIASKINNIYPTVEKILNGEYPISRSLFFYVKLAHIKYKPEIINYIDTFLSDDMNSEDGLLPELGLIPLNGEELNITKHRVKNREFLQLKDFSSH